MGPPVHCSILSILPLPLTPTRPPWLRFRTRDRSSNSCRRLAGESEMKRIRPRTGPPPASSVILHSFYNDMEQPQTNSQGCKRKVDGPRRRKRMKFSKLVGSPAIGFRGWGSSSGCPTTGVHRWGSLSQLFLVSVMGLTVAMLLSACQLVTIDYVYLAEVGSSGGNGQIQPFAVDSQSGALRRGLKTVDSGGPSPVSMAVTTDYANLYVANQGNNSVVHFAIATTGELSNKDSVTLPDTPAYLAVNAAGTFLFVVSGSTSATLSVYPLTKGVIGAVATQQALVIPGFETDAIV